MLIFWARGPWGPLGPRCRIRVETVTTYCQAGYLLSGKLPTIGHAPKRSRRLCTQQPHRCTQPIHRHAPKRHRHAPKRLHRLAPNNRILLKIAFFCKMKNVCVHVLSKVVCLRKMKTNTNIASLRI